MNFFCLLWCFASFFEAIKTGMYSRLYFLHIFCAVHCKKKEIVETFLYFISSYRALASSLFIDRSSVASKNRVTVDNTRN